MLSQGSLAPAVIPCSDPSDPRELGTGKSPSAMVGAGVSPSRGVNQEGRLVGCWCRCGGGDGAYKETC